MRQGAAIAERYAKENANLVLVARSTDELKEVDNSRLLTRTASVVMHIGGLNTWRCKCHARISVFESGRFLSFFVALWA